ncbi:MAG TPA: MlaD family protein [Candidatus Dormibacteraeota bacterium]|nr:MlaD family protein [Candidatus Dormibacteraeota bacterium]
MNTGRILRNAIMVAVFAAVCVLGMEFLAVNIGQPNPLSSDYTVHAVFTDADGVPTAADVRVAGVQVGKVTAVAHDPNNPGFSVVTLQISNGNAVPVYSNGFAMVRPKTLLGEKYIDLAVGNSAAGSAIPADGYIPVSHTSKDVENDEIFNAFDAQTRQQQKVVLQELDAATKDRAGDIQAILPQLTAIVQDLSPVARVYEKDNPQVDNIFVNFNTLMQTLADEHEQLAGLLANGNTALGAIAQRDDALIGTLKGFSDVANEFNTAMAPTVDAQRSALQKLAPTFDKLNQMFSLISDPQQACADAHNVPQVCGVAEVFTGTLLGNINYPNDQLTVTSSKPCAAQGSSPPCGAGPAVTTFWDSMFSNPTSRFQDSNCSAQGIADSSPSCSHSAQNIVLSLHCDEATSMISNLLGSILGSSSAAQQQINQIIATVNQQCSPSQHTGSSGSTGASNKPADFPDVTGPWATEASWLSGYTT